MSKEFELKFEEEDNLRILTRESSFLEFKESFNWNSRDEYAKSMIAFANKVGGYIVFGVSDNPRNLIGLKSKNFENLDESKISEYLNSIASPEIEFKKEIIVHERLDNKFEIGIIQVFESFEKPVLAIKNDGSIREGDIYYRYNARKEKIKYPELKKLLEDIKEKERKNILKHLKKIEQVGASNISLLNLKNGTIEGHGENLVIDSELLKRVKIIEAGNFRESGHPALKLIGTAIATKFDKVKITNEESAISIKISEDDLKKNYWGYYELIDVLKNRFIDFKMNKKFNEIRKSIIEKGLVYLRLNNPKSLTSKSTAFYPKSTILKEFDKHYIKK